MRWLARTVVVPGVPGLALSVGSHRGMGADLVCLDPQGVEVSGAQIQLGAWASTIGAASLRLVGEEAWAVPQYWTRGTVVELLLVPPEGLDAALRVAVGVVAHCRGRPPAYQLELADLPAALRQRLSRGSEADPRLFAGVGPVAEVAIEYLPNAAEMGLSSALDLVPVERGLLWVDASVPFYRQADLSGSALVTVENPTLPLFGTPTGPALVGDAVHQVAWLHGHPGEIALQVLCSTGLGYNGAWDVLPAGWGLAVPQELIDLPGWAARVSETALVWDVRIATPVEDAWAWMSSLLALAGMAVVRRGSLLTLGAAAFPGGRLAAEWTDEHILSVEDDEWWDSSVAAEAVRVVIAGATTEVSSATWASATLPHAGAEVRYELGEVVWEEEEAQINLLLSRLTWAHTRVPRRVVVLVPARAAQDLAPLDEVLLSTRRLRRWGGQEIARRVAVVLDVAISWPRGAARVSLAMVPGDEEVFGD